MYWCSGAVTESTVSGLWESFSARYHQSHICACLLLLLHCSLLNIASFSYSLNPMFLIFRYSFHPGNFQGYLSYHRLSTSQLGSPLTGISLYRRCCVQIGNNQHHDINFDLSSPIHYFSNGFDFNQKYAWIPRSSMYMFIFLSHYLFYPCLLTPQTSMLSTLNIQRYTFLCFALCFLFTFCLLPCVQLMYVQVKAWWRFYCFSLGKLFVIYLVSNIGGSPQLEGNSKKNPFQWTNFT